MKPFIPMLALLVFCSAAAPESWADPTEMCPRADDYADIISLKVFETHGGKLVLIRPPDLSGIRRGSGYASYHLVVLTDGAAFVGGADGVTLRKPNLSLELISRLGRMRYEPPKLAGKPVCVGFDVRWKAESPQAYEIVHR